MEAYSLDLRERICSACDEHLETREEVAEQFGVSRSFVQKLLRRRRREGSIAARPRGRGPAAALGERDRRRLRGLVGVKPDATLAELCESLREAGGAAVSVPTMCRALKALRLPLKKRRCTPASVTRRGCVRCVDIGRSGSHGWTPRIWSSWTRAASTRR
jgi:transposase